MKQLGGQIDRCGESSRARMEHRHRHGQALCTQTCSWGAHSRSPGRGSGWRHQPPPRPQTGCLPGHKALSCLRSSGKRPGEWVGVVWGAQERAGVPCCVGRQRLSSPWGLPALHLGAPCPAPEGPPFLMLAKQSPCLAPLTESCAAWLLGPSSFALRENQPGHRDHQLSHSHISGIFVEHLLCSRLTATRSLSPTLLGQSVWESNSPTFQRRH